MSFTREEWFWLGAFVFLLLLAMLRYQKRRVNRKKLDQMTKDDWDRRIEEETDDARKSSVGVQPERLR